MGCAVRIVIFAFIVRVVYAGYCSSSYPCQATCTTSQTYYSACGFLWLGRCTRSRVVYKQCTKLCYKSVCCSGYSGNSCNTPLCFGSTSCSNGGTCRSPNMCSCPRGFSSPRCNDIDECSGPHGCQHNCQNTHGSYRCTCRIGFILSSDLKSCEDLNECNVNHGGCSHNCNNNIGSFSCDCREGYKLSTDGRSCNDLNECSLGTSGCSQQCKNTAGSFTCSCNTGYSLGVNRRSCEDVDECADGTAKCDGYCNNTPGSYTCSCATGYIADNNGYSCRDINECDIQNGGCDQKCINEPGSYRCECRKGYKALVTGTGSEVCEDIDECTASSNICTQVCDNTDGSFICNCNTGFALHTDGISCIDINDCEGVICMNDGTCVDGLNKYTCTCETGFHGVHCETDINECELANGGCQDECVNSDGSFYCSCFENRELQEDGISCLGGEKENQNVFERLKIPRKLLPKPCFTVMLAKCIDGNDVIIFLSSTSEWYKLIADEDIMFTLGVVFANVNNLSIPLSLKGVEVTLQDNEFTLNYGVLYGSTEGQKIENLEAIDECASFELVESDLFDFTKMDSFMKTLLFSLFPALPSWLKFEKSRIEVLSVQDTKSSLVYGKDLDDVPWCQGAPVIPDHLYSVFKFSTGFKLKVLGDEVEIPKPLSSRQFCLIVDLCQHNGGTVFLMVPEGSRDLLLDINMFKALKDTHNLHIRPRGIGISFFKGISANYHKLSGQLWNGDTVFTPIQPDVNVWIGGRISKYDRFFTVEGNADIYFGVPSVQTMLTSMFVEEWTGLLDIQLSLSPVLRFPLFGKERSIAFPLLSSTVNAYLSIGGSNRQWCGDVSNPEGLFLSLMVELNPFKGIPFLQDFVFSSANQIHLFMNTDPQDNPLAGIKFSLTNDILELDNFINETTFILIEALSDIELALSSFLKSVIVKIKDTLDVIKAILQVHIKGLFAGNIKELIDHIEDVRQKLKQIRTMVYMLADETEFIINEAKDKFIILLENQVKAIEDNIRNITAEITEVILSSVGNYTGFGLKFSSDWTFKGLKFFGFDFEMVYSESDLFRCSRFEDLKKLLSGENALRFLGRASKEVKLGFFLTYEKGFGLGFALSTSSYKFLLQLQAHIQMLGIKVTGDLFISLKGLYFYIEGNIWDIFFAQIDVIAEVGKDWDQLIFNLRGRFVVKARKRRESIIGASIMQHNTLNLKRVSRQVQTESSSFQASYLDALKRAIQLISEEAQKRLAQAENALTSAQNGFTKAQDWLDIKQTDVRAANVAFDKAVEKLEETKQKLEDAKEPLRDAIQKLENTQRNIDNLCKIRECKRICIPGIKCAICHKKIFFVNVPYPCCRLTSCMLSFPDPICVLANIACRIIRAAAYLLLEAAKIFVRVVMLAFDVAKAAVSVAQFVVDKSRAVLVVAEGILELAKIGLEVAKGVFEAAKLALKAVRIVIGAAADVLQFVIEYGLKSIIDVRNCGFDITMSTKDLPVFEVSCEVNAFKLGWTEIKVTINFKNIIQSIWQAARATIKAIIDTFGGIFSGRKRRDIEFDASSRMHVLLRKIRESDDVNSTLQQMSDTIDLSKNISGFRESIESKDSDAESRVEIFREKCITITLIQNFMQDAFDSLQGVVNESLAYIGEIDDVKRQLQEISSTNVTSNNITIASVGISSEYAATDYNMTEDDIVKAIDDTKLAASEDPLLNEIQSAANVSIQSVDDEMKSVETIDYQNAWFTSMKNMTKDYFNESECEDFQDCIFYSISSLYVLYESESFPNISNIQNSILDLESLLIETFQNESSSIMDTASAFEYVLFHINRLVSMNLFCSEAPKFVKEPQNQTAIYGSDVSFFCNATGDPEPNFIWLKNDTIIQGKRFNFFTVSNVSKIDSYDKYNCIAGNVVANITSTDAYIIFHDENECQYDDNKCTQLCKKTRGSYFCSCFEGYFLAEDGLTCLDIDECSVDPITYHCDHTCNNTEGSFTCSCKDGYILQEDMSTCFDNNECLSNDNGCDHLCKNTNGSFICDCNDGYILQEDMKTCRDVDECMLNKGECAQKCSNTDGTFTCSCYNGYKLNQDKRTCDKIDECLNNNGGCDHICNNMHDSFSCSCKDGYSLNEDNRMCDDVNECLVNNGGCDHICSNMDGSFTCSCKGGYSLNEDDRICDDINECLVNNGGCDHFCGNTDGSFVCSCDEGYSIIDHKMCLDIDECLLNNGGCDHICSNMDGSFTCSCKKGHYLIEDNKTCVDIDECLDSKDDCDHTCNNINGSFTCSCNEGYNLDEDNKTCNDINECLVKNGGCKHICDNTDGSFTCSCHEGYRLQGDNTCGDIDECLDNNGECDHICGNTDGSFACSCYDRYRLHDNKKACLDIDECRYDKGGCDHTCSNTDGSFTCSCHDGYNLQENRTCDDIDECLNNNGGCDHICDNTAGSFTCMCKAGYTLNENERTCDDIDECLNYNGGCDHICRNTDGSFTCSCSAGYTLNESKRKCDNIDECLNDNGGCDHICGDTKGSFTCSCNAGYVLNENKRTCDDIDECIYYNGDCDHICGNSDGSFTCSCNGGYRLEINKRTCVDIDECLNNNGDCDHMCINTDGSFTCFCKGGFSLNENERTCDDINECLDNNGGCDHTCSNMDGSFTCVCKDGYILHENERTCVDIDECLENFGGCDHNCINTNGSFSCTCNDGFILHESKRKCLDINECNTNNGGCDQICINNNGSFNCLCNEGYIPHANGISCTDIDECLDYNGGCKHKCKNLDGSFKCSCNEGYQLDADSLSCIDINECADNHERCEDMCYNFDGTYRCVCSQGRLLSENGLSCKDVKGPSVSSTLLLSIESKTALRNFTLYTEIKKTLENYFSEATKANILVYINSIRAGSIVVDYTVVINEIENKTSVADSIVHAVVALGEDKKNLVIDGKPVPVKPILPTSDDPCTLREQLAGKCDENTVCQVIGTTPTCRKTNDDNTKEDYLTIAGPVLGGVAFIIACIVLIVCALQIRNYRKTWLPKRRNSSQKSGFYATPAFFGRKNLIWSFNRKVPGSASIQSVNARRSFPWMSSENDLKSANLRR